MNSNPRFAIGQDDSHLQLAILLLTLTVTVTA